MFKICACAVIDNSDAFMANNPNETVWPEGTIYYELSQNCPKHKTIYNFLEANGVQFYNNKIRVSLELLNKLKFKKFRNEIAKPKPLGRLARILRDIENEAE